LTSSQMEIINNLKLKDGIQLRIFVLSWLCER
jgi:hypothetical protein